MSVLLSYIYFFNKNVKYLEIDNSKRALETNTSLQSYFKTTSGIFDKEKLVFVSVFVITKVFGKFRRIKRFLKLKLWLPKYL